MKTSRDFGRIYFVVIAGVLNKLIVVDDNNDKVNDIKVVVRPHDSNGKWSEETAWNSDSEMLTSVEARAAGLIA